MDATTSRWEVLSCYWLILVQDLPNDFTAIVKTGLWPRFSIQGILCDYDYTWQLLVNWTPYPLSELLMQKVKDMLAVIALLKYKHGGLHGEYLMCEKNIR